MRQRITSLRALLFFASATVFFDTVFYAAIVPILPDYVGSFDLTKVAAGVLLGSYAAGTLLGSLPAGMLSRQRGTKFTVIVGLMLISLGSLVFGLANSIVLLDGARFVQGVGGAAAWTGALGWLLSQAPTEQRAQLVATSVSAAVVGGIVGPAVGSLADLTDPAPVFVGTAGIGVGLSTWALALQPSELVSTLKYRVVSTVRKHLLFPMWLVGLAACLIGMLEVLAPLSLEDLGISGALIGVAFLCSALTETFASQMMGRIIPRHGVSLAIRLALLSLGVIAFILPLPDIGWLLIVAIIASGLAFGSMWVPAILLISERTRDLRLDQGFAVALVNLAWASGQMIGSAGGGALAKATTDSVPYLIVAATCALTYRTWRSTIKPKQQSLNTSLL